MTQTLGHCLIRLDEHLDRLYHSAEKLAIHFSFSRDQLVKEIESTICELGSANTYIRIIITRGEGEIGLDPNLATKCNFIIMVKEQAPNPEWWYQKGVEMIVAQVKRNPVDSMDPNIKSGNYLNNVMAITEAKRQGAFDAIMLNQQGLVTESTVSNIWIVDENNVIKTPPLKAGILEGITRKSLLEICKSNNLKVLEENFNENQLKMAHECFLTSSTRHIIPVVKIDEYKVGVGVPGSITKKLIKMFQTQLQSIVNDGQTL